jgi:hypothetical protein
MRLDSEGRIEVEGLGVRELVVLFIVALRSLDSIVMMIIILEIEAHLEVRSCGVRPIRPHGENTLLHFLSNNSKAL